MVKPPPVTVVVPHFGAPGLSMPLLEALLRQQGCPELQIVLVDDDSPDAFPDHPGVTVIRRGTNGGFGSAVNTGAAVADGDLLLVLNSDLEIGPTFVADLVAGARPWQPAVVSPRVVGPDGLEQPTGRRFPRVRHGTEWLVRSPDGATPTPSTAPSATTSTRATTRPSSTGWSGPRSWCPPPTSAQSVASTSASS